MHLVIRLDTPIFQDTYLKGQETPGRQYPPDCPDTRFCQITNCLLLISNFFLHQLQSSNCQLLNDQKSFQSHLN